MVYYKGAVTYKEFQNMPIPEILKLQEYAEKINKKQQAELERQTKR
jgi:hypothetical protein